MSHDHTGFNESEVQRLRQEHPGEEPVDPQTGRVHGIAVSRAIGDARWKWTQELSELVHEKFWGPRPRPEGLIATPPYLTAEPEIMETKVQMGKRPDFLIMASDGLWDLMSSEDAVICVEQWLQQYKPADVIKASSVFKDPVRSFKEFDRQRKEETEELTRRVLQPMTADEDTYFDDTEKVMKWRVSPKHFVVEDANCGVHLVKNALGGSRRNLFRGVLALQPPLSRAVRDDISVHVIFFGDDYTRTTPTGMNPLPFLGGSKQDQKPT